MNRLLTVEEAAPILNVPETWLKKATADRNFPCTRIGRYVRFTEEDLAAIVALGRGRRVAA